MKMCFHEKTLSPIPGGISLRLGYGECGRIDAKVSAERELLKFNFPTEVQKFNNRKYYL